MESLEGALGWKPFTKEESSEIVQWIVDHNEFGKLGKLETELWKRMEKEGVCEGRRTWQSMKGHFR